MLKLIFAPALLLLVSVYANAEYCNWGYSGAKQMYCDGETYYYGSAACTSGIYQNLFCHESSYGDARTCAEDESPATVRCYKKLIGKVPETENKERDEWCNWGYSGPKTVRCGGKKYCYGTAACGSDIYHNVFCEEKYCTTGKACQDDNSSETIACFEEYLGKTSRTSLNSSGWPNARKSGTSSSGWPKSSKGAR